jgi:hypothetical protein
MLIACPLKERTRARCNGGLKRSCGPRVYQFLASINSRLNAAPRQSLGGASTHSGANDYTPSLYFRGVRPVRVRNTAEKWLWLEKPQLSATSKMVLSD